MAVARDFEFWGAVLFLNVLSRMSSMEAASPKWDRIIIPQDATLRRQFDHDGTIAPLLPSSASYGGREYGVLTDVRPAIGVQHSAPLPKTWALA